MNQRRHASEILKGFEMEHYNSEVTPGPLLNLDCNYQKMQMRKKLIQISTKGSLDH